MERNKTSSPKGETVVNHFQDKLVFSLAERQTFDKDVLKQAIAGCVQVNKTDDATDRTGVDYIATLSEGARIYIDAKARMKGASRYWKHNEPELALETWSVIPYRDNPGKVGWTLSESSEVDMILYTFDPSDCKYFYLLPFQHLRLTFIDKLDEWKHKYGTMTERSNGWMSEAIFVPASVVIGAICSSMNGIARSDI